MPRCPPVGELWSPYSTSGIICGENGEGAVAGVGFHLLEHLSNDGIEYHHTAWDRPFVWCHKVLRYVLPCGIVSGIEFECNHWAACWMSGICCCIVPISSLDHWGNWGLCCSNIGCHSCALPHCLQGLRERASDGWPESYTLTKLLATWPLAPLAHRSCATISMNCDQFWPGMLVHRGRGEIDVYPRREPTSLSW